MSGHNWSGWPGAYCLRCGAEHVLETAVAEGWLDCGPGPKGELLPDKWRSEGHKRLVELCDGTCYADLSPEEREKHGEAIRALCEELGVGGSQEVREGPREARDGPKEVPARVPEAHGCHGLSDEP